MANYRVSEEEFEELEAKETYGEPMTALERFRLDKARRLREEKPNRLQELAAMLRRNPLTGRE